MKPQQLATLLNIAPVTLRQWSRGTFKEFLSPNAQGENSAHRSYDDTDARILAWVTMLKAKNTPINEIVIILQDSRAKNWLGLPPLPGGMANDEPIEVIPREAAEERLYALEQRFKSQLEMVVKERDDLRTRLESTEAENKELQKRLMELGIKEAELRGKLEQYTVGGKRLNAVVLVAAAVIFGVVLTLVIVIISRLPH